MYPCNVDLALAALLVEATIGYPAFVYRAIGHPVTWMGALLAYLESSLNRSTAPDGQRRLLRVLVLAVLLATTGDVPLRLIGSFPWGHSAPAYCYWQPPALSPSAAFTIMSARW